MADGSWGEEIGEAQTAEEGAEPGVLEGLRLGLVQQQVMDSRPEHGVRGERPPLRAPGRHRPAGPAAQLQRPVLRERGDDEVVESVVRHDLEQVVYTTRPDVMAGRGGGDQWVVHDAENGVVLARRELETVGHGAGHHMHPADGSVYLDVGEGQDGSVLVRGTAGADGEPEFVTDPWSDRCLTDLAPAGRQFMTVDHDQADVAFHAHPNGDVHAQARSAANSPSRCVLLAVGMLGAWHTTRRVPVLARSAAEPPARQVRGGPGQPRG